MNLIYYRGLNCRLASILNIADILGTNYLDAFATLWSETDFSDDVKYDIYTSKRVYAGLDAIGIKSEDLACTEQSISRIADGELFFVGMDTFDIPWHPVFGHFHDPHYFFARKETAHTAICFDPVYNEKNAKIKAEDILSSAFELCRVYKLDANPTKDALTQEACAVLRSHTEITEALSSKMQGCINGEKSDLTTLLKQINAMLNNRYLFGHYLHDSASFSDRFESFFDKAFFSKWEAVRNGLYKAGIVKDNKSVIDEVCELFTAAMHEETDMAKEIAKTDLR